MGSLDGGGAALLPSPPETSSTSTRQLCGMAACAALSTAGRAASMSSVGRPKLPAPPTRVPVRGAPSGEALRGVVRELVRADALGIAPPPQAEAAWGDTDAASAADMPGPLGAGEAAGEAAGAIELAMATACRGGVALRDRRAGSDLPRLSIKLCRSS